MGGVKAEWMEAQERGWSAPDDMYVCADCVEDPFLKGLIRDLATATTCSYCRRHATHAIAADAGEVMEAIYNTVRTYYSEPTVAGVPYDEGFIVDPIDIAEVLDNLGLQGHARFMQ